ncbi:MAG: glycosyltransferase family 4 protein [Granulosicoccus sp.]
MIKVLNVMEDGRIAGPQLRMQRVAKCLEGKVFTLIAIPDSGPDEFRKSLIEADVPYVQLPLTKLSRSPMDIIKSLARMPWEIGALVKAIRKHDIDVVHSSGGAWMFKAIIAARFARCPAVWHLNDTSSPAPFRLLARALLRRWVAGVIVAGSRVTQHYLPDYEIVYKDKFYLLSIEAPVDTQRFLPDRREDESDGVVRLLTVGNISPVKDYLTVVRAARLLTEQSQIRWQVVGSSYASQEKYQTSVDREVETLGVDNLEFYGPSDNVVKHLQECDIYVCSSAAEASPTSVWEAMACGLPIVSTDVGCVRDYVKSGDNGFLVEPGDHEKMAMHILELAGNAELRRAMGTRNREIAEEAFDISVCASRHQDIYTRSIAMYAQHSQKR